MKLKGKTVLVTGASSGIGKEVALRCARDGARVILAARRKQKLEPVKVEVEKLGGEGVVIPTDVTDVDQVKDLFLDATEDGKTLDVVFNNAGLGYIGNIWEIPVENIVKIIDVNVKGMIVVGKYAAEVMQRQQHGHLIFCSSLAGLITLPQWSVYVASKWAITGFADSIRPELRPHKVLVTTLHPGLVKTEFFDEKKADINISEVGDAVEASEVAEKVYEAIFTEKKRILIPGMVKTFAAIYRYLPGVAQKQIEKMAEDADYHTYTKEDEPDFSYVRPVSKDQ